MLQTHYVKQRPHKRHEDDRGDMLTQMESVVYAVAPDDTLFTKDVLVHKYARQHKKYTSDYGKFSKTIKEIGTIVDDLVKKGYLKEIHGNRLENFLKTF